MLRQLPIDFAPPDNRRMNQGRCRAMWREAARRGWVLLVPLLLSLFAAVEAVASGVQESEQEELHSLIQGLGSGNFATRESSEIALAQRGIAVIEPMLELVQGADPERRVRAMNVLDHLAISMDEAVQAAAQDALAKLASSPDPQVAQLANGKQGRIRDRLHETALRKLVSLGAVSTVVGGFEFTSPSISAISLLIGPEWRGTRQDLESLKWVQGVMDITLIGDQIDDALIEALVAGNPSLQSIVLKRARITNATVASLAKLPALQRVQFVYCPIDDECFDDMAVLATALNQRLPGEFQILMFGTGLTGEFVERLEAQTSVRIDRRIGAYLGVYYNQGEVPCVITRVNPDSAAAKAGIEAGDRITEFEGRPIEFANDFRGAVAQYSPGDEVTALIERDGRLIEMKITLGEFPDLEN